MLIEIPDLSLVALIGVSGSGKSTFAKKHFKDTEILSSDYFRGLISNDENNQEVSKDAFETLYYVANKRLDRGLLTVIDATNLQQDARTNILELSKRQNCQAVAIVLDIPEDVCISRNKNREDRTFGDYVVKNHYKQLKRSIKYLKKEGFRFIYVINGEDELNNVEIVRKPLWSNKKDICCPLDIIGDIHGCYDELCELLEKTGYKVDKENHLASTETNRKALFLGDLCDRGTKNVDVLKLVMNMVENNSGFCILGNHEAKLLKILTGKNGQLSHGLNITMSELQNESEEFVSKIKAFLASLISHYVFDNGRLVVAHAGLKESMHGRASGKVKSFAIYGDTTGETDEFGLPVRLKWANDYRGKSVVVYGHTPTTEVENINNTYCIDTGCVFGGQLTAFRYPEKQIVQVKSKMVYYEPAKPLETKIIDDDMLNVQDVISTRYLNTKLRSNIKINEENSVIALEIMSRFTVDPHWLIYLPPTMSPCETSSLDNYLEYPTEAFEYYKSRGIEKVVCEEKHMGSRAVIIVCKNEDIAQNRFKVIDKSIGVIYSRTGRSFLKIMKQNC